MIWRRLMVVSLVAALVVTTIGWYRAAGGGRDFGTDKPGRFNSCTFDGSRLVLGYTYGANQLVAPSVDTRSGDKVIVSLNEGAGDGITPAIGLFGKAEFTIFSADDNPNDTVIEYTDGKRLNCSLPTDDEQ